MRYYRLALAILFALIVAGCARQPVAQNSALATRSPLGAAQPVDALAADAGAPPSSSATRPTANATPAPVSSGSGIYWGAFVGAKPYGLPVAPPASMKAIDFLEEHAGRGLSILHWGHPWFYENAYNRF